MSAASSPIPPLTSQNITVIENLFSFLIKSGYKRSENTKRQEIYLDPTNDANFLPTLKLNQDSEKKTLIIEILGSPWHIITELTFRYLKEIGVTFKFVKVFSIGNESKLFEVDGSTFPNIIFTVQQRLKDRDLFKSEIKIVLHLSTFGIGKKTLSTPSLLRKKPNLPIKGIKGIKTSLVSPVMFKRSKLSQLAKRDIPEPEPVYVPPPKPEIPEEYNLPILDELAEEEQIILKEILKRPKKKVQSNHIAKHTNLEQEVIRDVLRELVNKGILKVTSGWYVLKKQTADEEEEDETEKASKKTSKRTAKSSRKKKKAKGTSSKRTRRKKKVNYEDTDLESMNNLKDDDSFF